MKISTVRIIVPLCIGFFGSCLDLEMAPSGRCESDCTVIRGRFVTEDCSVSADGVELRLAWSTPPAVGLGLGGEYRLIAKTTTAKTGEYSFTFKIKESELTEGEFAISYAADPSRYYMVSGYDFLSLGRIQKRDTVIQADYYLPTIENLTIRILNPQEIYGDRNLSIGIRFRPTCQNGAGIGHELSIGKSYHNMDSDTIISASANRYNYVYVRKRLAENLFFNQLDSVFVQKGQPNTYEISF